MLNLERFDEIRKEIVIQNSSQFNDRSIDPNNCLNTLIDLIYIINQGNELTYSENENLFFGVTKLLNTKEDNLRRTVFLFLKHFKLNPSIGFILTGPLSAFIQSEDKMLKTNSFRLIGRLIDINSKNMIEQYIKIGISSTKASVDIASSSILCAYELTIKGSSIAKAWISEINDRLNYSLDQQNLLAFHTLLLLKEIKSNDKVYLLKTFLNICNKIKSIFANCQLIRFIVDLLCRYEIDNKNQLNGLYSYLEACCTKYTTNSSGSSEASCLEAIRGILRLPSPKPNKLVNCALDTLKQLLTSYKKVVVYGALKTLDQIAGTNSSIALDIFIDLEKILESNNHNISFKVLALSIFLKISKSLSEHRLERMLSTITVQYSLFKDEFKKEIVIISTAISQSDPNKYKIYFKFFTNLLKLQASENIKLEIVQAIKWFITNTDDQYKKLGMLCLAEYVEDCSYESLKTKILLILGKESVNMPNIVNQLVRHIYNRFIIEGPIVRSAAISALGEIAYTNNNLRSKIIMLIKNCFADSNNEVRERAYFYYKALTEDINESTTKPIKDYVFTDQKEKHTSQKNLNIIKKAELIKNILKVHKNNLLKSNNISKQIKDIANNPLDIEKLEDQLAIDNADKSTVISTNTLDKKSTYRSNSELDSDFLKTSLFKNYGHPKNVTKYIKLTDDTVEYKVSYKKLVYTDSIIFQFSIENTIEDHLLKNISASISKGKKDKKSKDVGNEFKLSNAEVVEIESLGFGETKNLYLRLTVNKNEESEYIRYPSISFALKLSYEINELDSKGNSHDSYEDTYLIEKKVLVRYSDFVFNKNNLYDNEESMFIAFNELSSNDEYSVVENKLKLPYKSIKKAIVEISKILDLSPINDYSDLDKNAVKYQLGYANETVYGTKVSIYTNIIY